MFDFDYMILHNIELRLPLLTNVSYFPCATSNQIIPKDKKVCLNKALVIDFLPSISHSCISISLFQQGHGENVTKLIINKVISE